MVLVFLGASCGRHGTVQSASTTTTTASPLATSTSSSTTASPAGAEVLTAYRDFWDAFRQVTDPPAPESDLLAQHATGQELSDLRVRLTRLRTDGIVIRGTIDLDPRVESMTNDAATVRDCHDASHFLKYDAKTGELRDTVDPNRVLWSVAMVQESGVWKVATVTEQGRCAGS